MLAATLEWLRHHDGPLAYALLGLASLIEYVFPPFPGDTIALFGVYSVMAAGFDGPSVYAALVTGAMIGGQAMWWIGRRVGRGAERPRFARGPQAVRALAEVTRHFEAHGTLFLVGHRFVPALRAFVFVGAGMSGLSFWRVLVLGGVSAALWNAALFGVGALVASQWEVLTSIVSIYSWIALAAVGTALAVVLARRRRRSE